MSNHTRWYRELGWSALLLWVMLVAIGLVAIYSATHGPAAEFLAASVRKNFQRQLMWVGVSTLGMAVLLSLPVRFYRAMAYPIYGLTIGLLVAALLLGKEVNGAKSWLYIGGMGIQASELAKVGTLLAVARLLSVREARRDMVRYALLAVALILLPAAIIILQNDAGTALVFLALIPAVLFWSGLPIPIVLLLVSPALAGYLAILNPWFAVGFSALFGFVLYLTTRERYLGVAGLLLPGVTTAITLLALHHILKPHQLARIASFVHPEQYRLTTGFHVIQARAAIGSGGLFGKGFMQGTQTQLAFVPEQSTDFVFCVIGEEFGFIGSLTVLLLFALLLIQMLRLGSRVKHPFAHLFTVGAVWVLFTHVLINIGMATALLPVIGIPLPFISYGGSAMIAHTTLLALVLNFAMRKDEFSIYSY